MTALRQFDKMKIKYIFMPNEQLTNIRFILRYIIATSLQLNLFAYICHQFSIISNFFLLYFSFFLCYPGGLFLSFPQNNHCFKQIDGCVVLCQFCLLFVHFELILERHTVTFNENNTHIQLIKTIAATGITEINFQNTCRFGSVLTLCYVPYPQ